MVGLETFPAMLDSQRSFGHGTEGPLAHFRTGCSRERAVRPSSYTLNRFQKIDRLSESSAVDIEAVVSLFSEDICRKRHVCAGPLSSPDDPGRSVGDPT